VENALFSLLDSWRVVARTHTDAYLFIETDILENSCTIRTYAYLPPAGTYAATAREIPDMYAPQVFDGVHRDPQTWLAHSNSV